MRLALTLVLLLFPALLNAASAKLLKVLPHFVDREGRHTLSPSLYERDAYQAELRRKPEMRSGMRFDVHWKGTRKVPLALKVELRGNRAGTETHADIHKEISKRGWFNKWSSVELTGEDYKNLGEMVAWRTTLWAGDQLLDEQHSFLW